MPRPVPPRAPISLFVALLSLVFSPLPAAPWREAESDLSPHPQLRQGTLPNGLRYFAFPNAEPKDRVSLRLVVAVGSIHENKDELGLAHFVEHMAFRGTRTHPAGSLTAALQRLGIGLGPDTAAFTSYDHTTYHLDLPDATDATLRDGLRILREFAQEITFDPKPLEVERGVVLSELATRDTPEARSHLTNLDFLWPNSRHTLRPIGGTVSSLQLFTRSYFTAFYDAWYRPERMAVILVGQIAPEAAERAIAEELGKIVARGAPRPEPPQLIPESASSSDIRIFADPGLVGVRLSFEHPVRVSPHDFRVGRIERLHRSLAAAMFHARLQRIAHEPGTSFAAPIMALNPALLGWELLHLSVGARIDDWRQAAADLEREHRRVLQFGFTEKELDEARRNFAANLQHAVETAATWPSPAIAQQLVSNLVHGRRFTSPETAQRDLAAPLANATTAHCLAAFQRAWTTAAPHVFVAAHPGFQITRVQLAAALNESRQSPVEAHTEKPNADQLRFAYGDLGAPGRLDHHEHVPDLDVRLTRFENGVRFNFKQTAFSANDVEIRVRVGEGKLTQPEHLPGLDLLANAMVSGGGLGRHTTQELSRVLAGNAVSVGFTVEPDACLFTARCAPRDLALALQVITAFLTDAAYRPEMMRDTRASFTNLYASLDNTPSGPIALHAVRDLAGGDRRFGLPAYDDLLSRDLDQLKAWIEPQFKRGAIEMSIAGDVSWPVALAAVSVTFGALPAREPRRVDADTSVRIPAAPAAARTFPIRSALHQTAIAWYWPVHALADIRQERRCRLLAAVLDDRIRLRIRDELGAAYSTTASFVETTGFPHFHYFVAFAEVAPRHANKAMEIIQRETAALVKKGVEPDEFLRAHRPFVRARADDLRLNSYWGGTVLGDAQLRPQQLAAARDRATDTAAITAPELSALAKLHLSPAKSFRFAAIPVPAPPRPLPAAASAPVKSKSALP